MPRVRRLGFSKLYFSQPIKKVTHDNLGDSRAADTIRGQMEGRPMTEALLSIEDPWDSALMAASILGTEETLPEFSRTSRGATVFRKP
ncbi:hypothetical protein ES288_A11G175300v1 [Gossypium darwinii]|uniref:Uncharacterized protein n=1 Tax=Gossypium darwinii TaxID=34276 RepID=A0A5D2EM13_GOSDA|nr:hypothetical protein ES288_A11G175300v1 [Gossypium darwinii]